MSAVLELDYQRVKSLVDQLNDNEKIKLAEYLDKETAKKRFSQFRKKMKSKKIPITIDEITKEVEIVREQMYQERLKNK